MSAKLAKRLIEPDYWTCPHGVRARPEVALTYGPEVAEINAKANFEPDAQQQLGLDLIFAIRPDGSPATFEFCVICCRQNLKTGLFKQVVLGWLYVTEQRLIVWSAHEMSTTREAHRELAELIQGAPSLSRRLKATPNHGIYDANGEERIELATGQRVMFKARTRDGGRGLAAPKLILDEAFALKAAMMGALIPLMLAQGGEGQVLYGSSAGKADSEVLFDIRERGRNGTSPRLSYIEWTAPVVDCAQSDCTHPKSGAVGCALDRDDLLLKANPTVSTGRITLETLHDSRQALPPAEFMRECLGWWDEPDEAGEPAIDSRQWSSLSVPNMMPADRASVSLSLAISPDRKWGTIGLTTAAEDGRALVMVKSSRSHAFLVEELVRLAEENDLDEVALDPASQAGSLIPDIETAGLESGLKVYKMTAREMAQSCGGLLNAVDNGTLVHLGQAELDAAASAARTKGYGEAQRWDAIGTVDPSPIVAVSIARHRFAGADQEDYDVNESVLDPEWRPDEEHA